MEHEIDKRRRTGGLFGSNLEAKTILFLFSVFKRRTGVQAKYICLFGYQYLFFFRHRRAISRHVLSPKVGVICRVYREIESETFRHRRSEFDSTQKVVLITLGRERTLLFPSSRTYIHKYVVVATRTRSWTSLTPCNAT